MLVWGKRSPLEFHIIVDRGNHNQIFCHLKRKKIGNGSYTYFVSDEEYH